MLHGTTPCLWGEVSYHDFTCSRMGLFFFLVQLCVYIGTRTKTVYKVIDTLQKAMDVPPFRACVPLICCQQNARLVALELNWIHPRYFNKETKERQREKKRTPIQFLHIPKEKRVVVNAECRQPIPNLMALKGRIPTKETNTRTI